MSDYPRTAGHHGGASKEAADKIERTGLRRTLRRAVLALFEKRPRWSPDEAAKLLGFNPLDVRPRFSELTVTRRDRDGNVIEAPYLRKTKRRRKSSRGNPQHVYERLPPQLEMSDWWT